MTRKKPIEFAASHVRVKHKLIPLTRFQSALREDTDEVCYDLRDGVLAISAMSEVSWSTLFAYMHRRFGPPSLSGDPYKSLCGGWLLDTSDADVFVRVEPNPSGAWLSFTPYAAAGDAFQTSDNSADGRVEQAKTAYLNTLNDLLRPVCVRDNHIDANGYIEDDKLDYDKSVEPHDSSVQGVPLDWLDEDFHREMALTWFLGDRDHSAGRKRMIAMMEEAVVARLAQEPVEVRAAVLAQLRKGSQEALTKGIGLSAEEAEIAADVVANTHHPYFDVVPLAMAEAASPYVTALGEDEYLVERTRQRDRDARMTREWEALQATLVTGDFPDACLPEPGTWAVTKVFATSLPSLARDAGNENLAEWAERLLAEDKGDNVIGRFLSHLIAKRDEASKAPKP